MDKSGRLEVDINEVNGTVSKEKESVVVEATYKKLPDEDTNWQPKDNPEKIDESMDVKMVKQNGTDAEDEATERMLQENVKLSPKKDNIEVKYVSENGDAKIDFGAVKEVLSGMGKEELMKFANDPFWIRLRWFLFISFWFLWASMLAGAVAIIVVAPKCNSPEPRKWWQESPIVQLDEFDTPNRKIEDFETLLAQIAPVNIKGVSLSSIVEKDRYAQTIDFRGIQPHLGTVEDLKLFIKSANERGQKVILQLDPNHSSLEHKWFKESVAKRGNYSDYYVWANPKIENGVRSPPNNWLSVFQGSAWEWNEQRGQYYLHQFTKNQPDLNYNNPDVVNEFGEILKYWLDVGFSGFSLENTQYLTEDSSLQSETLQGDPESYHSLNHVKTRERVENGAILRQWRNIVLNKTNGEGLFILKDDIANDILQVFNDKNTGGVLIDLPQSSQFLTTANANVTATVLKQGITNALKMSEWPAWEVNGKSRPLRLRATAPVADSLTLMILLLPGTPILKFSDVISAQEVFAKVSKTRETPGFLYGETKTYIMNNTGVFAYTRLKSGNPGYLVAYNSDNKTNLVDFSSISDVGNEVKVLARSPNSAADGVDTTITKYNTNSVPMAPKSTIILSFVTPEATA